MKRMVFVSILSLGLCILNGVEKEPPPRKGEIVLAMCQPTVSQIRNIEEMWEKDILPVAELKLVGVFHEDEEIDYGPAREYVRNNGLAWVSFRPITGKVENDALFRENLWTQQFREIFNSTSGILFTGGDDIPPSLYGQEQNLLTEVLTPMRSRYEISFLFHLLGGSQNPAWIPFLEKRKDYPILAICLGSQSLNVATGGTLVQDIPSQIYGLKTVEQVLKLDRNRIHSSTYDAMTKPGVDKLSPHFHQIRFKKESLFVGQMEVPVGWQPMVRSSHHQSIDKLGQKLVATAFSMDGKIVEAAEHQNYPHVLGIQFHPEAYQLYKKGLKFRATPDQEPTLNLRAFLESDGISMAFHRQLWRWFCSQL